MCSSDLQAVLVVDHRGTGRGGHDGTSQGGALNHGLFSVKVIGSPTCRGVGKGTSSSMQDFTERRLIGTLNCFYCIDSDR